MFAASRRALLALSGPGGLGRPLPHRRRTSGRLIAAAVAACLVVPLTAGASQADPAPADPTASSATTTPATPASSDPAAGSHAAVLPAVKTGTNQPPAPTPPAGPVGAGVPPQAHPAADYDTALRAARAAGARQDITGWDDAGSTFFVNPNGTITAEQSAGPVRVARGAGWVPVDTTLVAAAGGAVSPVAAADALALSAGGSAPLVSFGDGAGRLQFGWAGALPAPVLTGSTATYPNVVPGGDLLVTATRSGFELSLRLNRRPTGPLVLNLPTSLSGWTVSQDPTTGALALTDTAGHQVASSPAPSMFTAATDPASGEPLRRAAVSSQLVGSGTSQVLRLSPDAAFLADPATSYPVIIDPPATLALTGDTYTQSSFPTSTSGWSDTLLKVGTFNGGSSVDRSYIGFDTSGIQGATVTAATLTLDEEWAFSCTATPMLVNDTAGSAAVGAGTTWSNQPASGTQDASATFAYGWNSAGVDGATSSCPQPTGGVALPMTAAVQRWAADGAGTHTVVLSAASTTDSTQWKKFSSAEGRTPPRLSVTYAPHDPYGTVDTAAQAAGGYRVTGWEIDPDAQTTAGSVDLYLDGTGVARYTANTSQPDVGAAYPGAGDNHGFDITVGQTMTPGNHTACVYGINTGLGANTLLRCIAFTASNTPYGNLDRIARAGAASVRVSGWTIDPDSSAALSVDVYLDGTSFARYTANAQRADVGAAHATYGDFHGFEIPVPLDSAAHNVCVYAINTGAGSTNPQLGCTGIGAVDYPLASAGTDNTYALDTRQLGNGHTLSTNLGTGNLIVQTSDLSVPGIDADLPVGRVYNSLTQAQGVTETSGLLGKGWQLTTGADTRVAPQGDGSVLVYTADGQRIAYTPAGGGAYTGPPSFHSDLKADTEVGNPGGYRLTTHQSQVTLRFNSLGQIISRDDRNFTVGQPRNRMTFTYAGSPARLNTITGTKGTSPGNAVYLRYGTNGLLTAICRTGDTTVASSLATPTNDCPASTTSTHTWRYAYTTNAFGTLLASATSPTGSVVSYGYDSTATGTLLTSILLPTGPTAGTATTSTTIGYNGARQPVAVTQDSGGIGAFHNYDYIGGQSVLTDSKAGRTTYTFDNTLRPTGTTDPLGRSQSKSYNSSAKVTQTTNSASEQNQFAYGANGGESQTGSTASGGATTATTYGLTGPQQYLPASGTNAAGDNTSYTYSGPGNLQSSSEGAGGATASLSYNDDGTVKDSTDPTNQAAGNRTTYTYNVPTHELTSITPPTGNSLLAKTLGYDLFGRLATLVRTVTVNGVATSVTTTYGYDKLDRLISTTSSDPSTAVVTQSYDRAGNVRSIVDGNGTTSFTTDPVGRLTDKTGPDGHVGYGYDTEGNTTRVDDLSFGGTTSTSRTSYAYDAANQLTSMTEPSGRIDSFGYDGAGRRQDSWYDITGPTSTPATWAVHVFADNTKDRLNSITSTRASSNAPANIVAKYTYTYLAGTRTTTQKQTVTDNAGTITTYGYTRGRLTSASRSTGGGYTYGYDSDGNITNLNGTTLSYNSANQLTNPGAGYDGNGNLTASPTAGALGYDGAERTTGITNTQGTATTLGYIGPGQSARLTLGTVTATNGSAGVLAEKDSSTGTLYRYIRDPQGTLIGQVTPSGQENYYVTDGLGSTVALIADQAHGAGTVASYTYDPYGNSTSTETPGSLANPWRWAGGHLDLSTGLYHFGKRYYDPRVGRWTQQDSLISLGDLSQGNRYQYAAGDPVNNLDPTGAISLGGIISTVVGGVVGTLGAAAFCAGTGGFGCALLAGAAAGAIGGAVGGAIGATIDGQDPTSGLVDGAVYGAIGGALGSVGRFIPTSY